MIRYKDLDTAIKMIEEVIVMRRAVGMNNRQVGHKHQAGIMAGRYPITAAKEFLRMLKHLKANAVYNELELEKCRLSECVCNMAGRPYKRGGARAKRSHVMLKLTVKNKEINKSKKVS